MKPANPETLSADELAYHQALAGQVRAAQAAWQSWSAHLAARYRLGDGDGIAESGEVVRGEQPGGPPPVARIVPLASDEGAAG